MRRYPAQYRTRGVKGRQSKAEAARIGRTRMLDERESFKAIRLFKQDSKAIERALWETYNAIYALTFATELDGVEMEDSEIEEIVDELQARPHLYHERDTRIFRKSTVRPLRIGQEA